MITDIPELPNSPEDEEATLGALLLNRDAIAAVAAWLTPDMFYLARRGWVYESIASLYAQRIPPEIQTVASDLKRRGRLEAIGGYAELSRLISQAPTSYHVEYYARRVAETAADRLGITAGSRIAALFYDQTIGHETKYGTALQLLDSTRLPHRGGGLISAARAAELEYARLDASKRGELPSGGARSGFRDLDELLLGLNDSDFIIVAARPSVGKTALTLGLAAGVSTHNDGDYDALFFSLEMSEEQLRHRMLAGLTRLDTMRIRSLRLTDAEDRLYLEALGAYDRLPLFVDETPAVSVAHIRERALRHVAERERKIVVFVDYIQLMTAPQMKRDNSVQYFSEISRSMKALAKELACPVVGCSQLSRKPDERQSHVPLLSDLRETGSLEQDADIVLMLYREELYDKETDKRGVAEVHVAKNRNGPVGVVPLRFDSSTTMFHDLTYRAPGGFDEAARRRGAL